MCFIDRPQGFITQYTYAFHRPSIGFHNTLETKVQIRTSHNLSHHISPNPYFQQLTPLLFHWISCPFIWSFVHGAIAVFHIPHFYFFPFIDHHHNYQQIEYSRNHNFKFISNEGFKHNRFLSNKWSKMIGNWSTR